MARKAIPKTVRFEVFKRDKFACQYCGGKAPEVVLHLDHIKPIAEGGGNEVMNLVTSCAGCNGGKGARPLEDHSIVERQRRQIEELEERRQQLEMMLQWRDGLAKMSARLEETVCDHILAATGYTPNERGKVTVRRWLKKFPLEIILSSIDSAFDLHGQWVNDDMTNESWSVQWLRYREPAK